MLRFVEMKNIARKFGLQTNQEKTKYMIVERKNSLKKNKIGHLKIKNYKFERVENYKYLGVTPNEENNNQIDLQERIKNVNTTYFMLQKCFKNKNVSKKLKLRLKNTIIDKTLTYTSETWTLTKRDRKQLNIFERKVYRRILGPVYDSEKENQRILTNKFKFKSDSNLTRIMGAVCEDLSKITISCQIFLRIQQQDDNSCTEEHILCFINFFPKITPL